MAHFGPGIGRVLLDNVGCLGSEERLIDCYKTSVSCVRGHLEDAGVRCQIQGLLTFKLSVNLCDKNYNVCGF